MLSSVPFINLYVSFSMWPLNRHVVFNLFELTQFILPKTVMESNLKKQKALRRSDEQLRLSTVGPKKLHLDNSFDCYPSKKSREWMSCLPHKWVQFFFLTQIYVSFFLFIYMGKKQCNFRTLVTVCVAWVGLRLLGISLERQMEHW